MISKKLIIFSTIAGCFVFSPVKAQTSKAELLAHLELATGNYCNYPLPSGHVTPAPEGYEPFYVSHYGRHGARYMTDDVLVKFLMNENETSVPIKTDCYPFYHWKDVSAYYRNILNQANVQYK